MNEYNNKQLPAMNNKISSRRLLDLGFYLYLKVGGKIEEGAGREVLEMKG